MRLAILSDIHANDESLSRVLADARTQGVEGVVCLGDVVGYGPQPTEALRRLQAVAMCTVKGNHDAAVVGEIATDDFNAIARDAVVRHRAALDEPSRAWLKALPLTARQKNAAYAHGDFVDSAAFGYVETPAEAAASFSLTREQLLFVGHTHQPKIFVLGASGVVHELPPQDFTCEPGKRYLVNVGSVGYPREANGRCFSTYVIYDDGERTVRYRLLPFSVASVLQRGGAPRRGGLRKILLLLSLGFFLTCLALVLFSFSGGVPARNETSRQFSAESADSTPVQPAVEPVSCLARKQVSVGTGKRQLRVNLKVENGPVQLLVTFRDATDKVLAQEHRFIVKHENRRALRIPAEATIADVALFKLHADDAPRILQLNPAVEREGNGK